METTAIVLEQPRHIALRDVALTHPQAGQAVVDVNWSGISTGTEKMLWDGTMPTFPGMGYPLVPGYESVGRVVEAAEDCALEEGTLVFVPGARCYDDVRPLFGATAATLVVDAGKVYPVTDALGQDAVLLALAATAHHALVLGGGPLPDLIVGHGVLGRLLARIAIALGGDAPTLWEINPARLDGARGYALTNADDDDRRDYARIIDASGDVGILDLAVSRLRRRGEIVLAGFYARPLSFTFPPAFMREAQIAIAAEFQPADVRAVLELVAAGRLDLSGLISHTAPARSADTAYRTAFDDPGCTKMILDWEQDA
ncbi:MULTISPECIES: chlorophyll synthesis pathway protein BchC [unclassified Roseitalea]|uniref:chlorophyll synthesis pathway protein BchC n=1 Tax=unclassified Roseitalea TaxID=2639107 RepID=UPI00273E8E13|nr:MULTISPECIES: chlorophyll synthesis pathway protein BchC [unclassified Roseitalea]